MALGLPIPPWLTVTPGQHAQASESGLNAGIQAAHIWAQAAAERQRLAESARQHDREAAMEAERLQQKSVYDAQKLAADVAYNKAALSQAEARIKQTQDNAKRMAMQWAAQQQVRQQQLTEINRDRATRLALEQQRETRLGTEETERAALARERAAETARHNLAMEGKGKGVSEDEALKAYAKTSRETKEGPGLLGKIKNLFSGGPAAAPSPTTAKKLERANALANEHTDWTKEQIIKAVNEEFSKPAVDEEPSDDER